MERDVRGNPFMNFRSFVRVVFTTAIVLVTSAAYGETRADASLTCHDDPDCGCGSICTNGYCQWDPTAARRDGASCSNDGDCRANCDTLTCVASVCARPTCARSSDCGCGAECQSGQCFRASSDVSVGSACGASDDCRPECTSLQCVVGRCSRRCATDLECSCNEACVTGICDVGRLPQEGAACSDASACRTACTGLTCLGGHCARACSDRTQCLCRQDCVDGACVQQAANWNTVGLPCESDQACRPECISPGTMACQNGACVAIAPPDAGVPAIDASPDAATGAEPMPAGSTCTCASAPGAHDARWRGWVVLCLCGAFVLRRSKRRNAM